MKHEVAEAIPERITSADLLVQPKLEVREQAGLMQCPDLAPTGDRMTGSEKMA
jgi:hypothetical protein